MKTAITAVIGLVAGFLAGILLSDIIGIVGFLMFGRAIGIKYLPIYLAVSFAVVAPAARAWIRRRTK
jgi:Family of unknown function (DUF5957)